MKDKTETEDRTLHPKVPSPLRERVRVRVMMPKIVKDSSLKTGDREG